MSQLTARQVVEAFFSDWETGFVGSFEKWIAEDAVWQNTGMPDVAGKPAIMEHLRKYNDITNMPYGRVEMINIMSEGDTVLTERIDHLWGEGPERHSVKIMGALQARDGKIVRYSDYLDIRAFEPEKFEDA
ncbi:hypothetical protein GCM10011371_03610 [Novosphingobium marinum]|uniref:Limonene-1,2-epoxide hydrolase n=1 Tax=Novosphingobium marinum TaxID=1514948 RepID=A0A7Z0BTG3_9SPHN|nr:limonene-1,2-epoxide hydrolase family protein [Novosphingobium marinum]NYH94053.1 limonene-1,2-epoxide hydrolase [Novosphingobium marinum]GGC19231.1 hypothetical protein GCM10011371_03610 [Novosphingobium marinum]